MMNEKEGPEEQHPYCSILDQFCLNYTSSTTPLMWVTGPMNTHYFMCLYQNIRRLRECNGYWEMERWRIKSGQSRPTAERERETNNVCEEAKWERKQKRKGNAESRKPLAPRLQSAICWWRGSWRGGAQRPFLAMRSSLINKTKRVSCVTPICYLHPCSRTPFISI